MQVYIDEVAINRKAKIGKSLSFTGLGIMIVSLVFASREPDHINTIFILAMIGLFSSQIGIGMVNRWTRRPRVDENSHGLRERNGFELSLIPLHAGSRSCTDYTWRSTSTHSRA